MELATLGLPFSTPCMGRIRPRAFPYRFTASSVEVWGTNYPQTTANGGVDPTWECFVDNVSIGATAYFQIISCSA